MKIKIKKDDILPALERAIKFCDPNSVLPIASMFLVVGNGEDIKIMATDIKSHFIARCKGATVDTFAFCVPAVLFFSIIKDFRDQKIEISIPDFSHILIGKGKSRYKMSCISPSEFNEDIGDVKPVNSVSLLGSVFKELAANTSQFVASADDLAKINMQGVNILSDKDKLVMMATDVIKGVFATAETLSMIQMEGIMVDAETLTKACIICGNESSVDIVHDGSKVRFSVFSPELEMEFHSATLGHKFVTSMFMKIVGTQFNNQIELNTVEAFEVIKRVGRVSDKETKVVTLAGSSGNYSFSAYDDSNGNSAEEDMELAVPAETNSPGDFSLHFGGGSLQMIFKQIENQKTWLSYNLGVKGATNCSIVPVPEGRRDTSYQYFIGQVKK